MCEDETRRNELHVLCNYEPTLQDEECVCVCVQGVVFPAILPALL